MSRNRINHAILLRKDRTRYFKNFKYPNIPLSEDDIYVITTIEDRLDSLAYQFYSDVRLWWVIANANPDLIKSYAEIEKENTNIDLYKKIKPIDNEKNNEILVEIDGNTFDNEEFRHIQNLSEIIQGSGEVGRFELGNLILEIVQLNTYENNLIKL